MYYRLRGLPTFGSAVRTRSRSRTHLPHLHYVWFCTRLPFTVLLVAIPFFAFWLLVRTRFCLPFTFGLLLHTVTVTCGYGLHLRSRVPVYRAYTHCYHTLPPGYRFCLLPIPVQFFRLGSQLCDLTVHYHLLRLTPVVTYLLPFTQPTLRFCAVTCLVHWLHAPLPYPYRCTALAVRVLRAVGSHVCHLRSVTVHAYIPCRTLTVLHHIPACGYPVTRSAFTPHLCTWILPFRTYTALPLHRSRFGSVYLPAWLHAFGSYTPYGCTLRVHGCGLRYGSRTAHGCTPRFLFLCFMRLRTALPVPAFARLPTCGLLHSSAAPTGYTFLRLHTTFCGLVVYCLHARVYRVLRVVPGSPFCGSLLRFLVVTHIHLLPALRFPRLHALRSAAVLHTFYTAWLRAVAHLWTCLLRFYTHPRSHTLRTALHVYRYAVACGYTVLRCFAFCGTHSRFTDVCRLPLRFVALGWPFCCARLRVHTQHARSAFAWLRSHYHYRHLPVAVARLPGYVLPGSDLVVRYHYGLLPRSFTIYCRLWFYRFARIARLVTAPDTLHRLPLPYTVLHAVAAFALRLRSYRLRLRVALVTVTYGYRTTRCGYAVTLRSFGCHGYIPGYFTVWLVAVTAFGCGYLLPTCTRLLVLTRLHTTHLCVIFLLPVYLPRLVLFWCGFLPLRLPLPDLTPHTPLHSCYSHLTGSFPTIPPCSLDYTVAAVRLPLHFIPRSTLRSGYLYSSRTRTFAALPSRFLHAPYCCLYRYVCYAHGLHTTGSGCSYWFVTRLVARRCHTRSLFPGACAARFCTWMRLHAPHARRSGYRTGSPAAVGYLCGLPHCG